MAHGTGGQRFDRGAHEGWLARVGPALVAAAAGVGTSMPFYGLDYGMYWSFAVHVFSIPFAALSCWAIRAPRRVSVLVVSLAFGETAFAVLYNLAYWVSQLVAGKTIPTGPMWGLSAASVLVACVASSVPVVHQASRLRMTGVPP